MSETNTKDDCHDMPCLLCGKCDKVSSKGGSSWESENPSIKMCDCSRKNVTNSDERAKKFAKGLQGGKNRRGYG
jgi:hypothetical protein